MASIGSHMLIGVVLRTIPQRLALGVMVALGAKEVLADMPQAKGAALLIGLVAGRSCLLLPF